MDQGVRERIRYYPFAVVVGALLLLNWLGILAQYTGRMEADLRQIVQEKTPAQLTSYLQFANAEIKGVAVSEPTTISDAEVDCAWSTSIRTATKFSGSFLKRSARGGRSRACTGAEREKTLVPYGTPVE